MRPQWDAVAGNSAGDPHLDIDDLTGYGPENINVDALPAGEFLLGVNVYTSTGLTTNVSGSLRYGSSPARSFGPFPMDSATVRWRDVAIVVSTGSTVCFEDLLDGNATDDCPR
jgi:hypothetical protein